MCDRHEVVWHAIHSPDTLEAIKKDDSVLLLKIISGDWEDGLVGKALSL